MKPYVICHMLGSVDGRIKQDIWGFKDHHKYFEETAEKIPADAWLVGRVTMEEFSSKNNIELSSPGSDIPYEDFIGDPEAKAFAVVVDPSGKCLWDSNMVSTEHVIEVLSKKVGQAYLAHLQSRKVSYIFAGEDSLDLELALTKLYKLFNIKVLRIDGGGHVNGSFLKADLIDELSLVWLPLLMELLEHPHYSRQRKVMEIVKPRDSP